MTNLRRGLVRNYPLEPTFHKGRSGKKYDHYTCGNCGFGVTEAYIKYCENCGQRLTDAYAGRRKTHGKTQNLSGGAAADRPPAQIQEEVHRLH